MQLKFQGTHITKDVRAEERRCSRSFTGTRVTMHLECGGGRIEWRITSRFIPSAAYRWVVGGGGRHRSHCTMQATLPLSLLHSFLAPGHHPMSFPSPSFPGPPPSLVPDQALIPSTLPSFGYCSRPPPCPALATAAAHHLAQLWLLQPPTTPALPPPPLPPSPLPPPRLAPPPPTTLAPQGPSPAAAASPAALAPPPPL
jgi:hypothetical protein